MLGSYSLSKNHNDHFLHCRVVHCLQKYKNYFNIKGILSNRSQMIGKDREFKYLIEGTRLAY